MDTFYDPLMFFDTPKSDVPRGYYDGPNGKNAWDGGAAVGFQAGYAAPDAGVTDYWAVWERPGTVVNGRCYSDKPWTIHPARFTSGPHPIGPPNSPPPDWRIYIDQAKAGLKAAAGQPGTLPRPDQGLVNLPQCYWVDGLQNDHNQAVTIEGPADPSGRHIRYTLLIRASLGQVEWDFGDGDPTTVAAPLACGSHGQIVGHLYRRFDDFVAVAHEHWTVRADVYWMDSDGAHRLPVDVGPQPPPVDTPPRPVHIGQIQGVPGS